ncbi:MAG: PAS domain S-box protein [Cyanobacteria bacterium NC_groundwater_1444_Ag_S-0.65um_54_12]|nr:PAS domain S-box protein [Cyanobacteria bacterium NC_groundwater_1444_Ag_S-0.65um_54_12]
MMIFERKLSQGLQVRTKLLLVLGLPFAVCFVLVAIAFFGRTISENAHQMALQWRIHASMLQSLQIHANEYLLAIEHYLKTPDPLDKQYITESYQTLEQEISNFAQFSRKFPEGKRQDPELLAALTTLVKRGVEVSWHGEQRDLTDLQQFYKKAIAVSIQRQVKEEEELSRRISEKARQSGDRMLIISVLAVGLPLFASLLLSLFTVRNITRSLTYLQKETNRISKGDLEGSIALPSGDEIGQLAAAFNRMAINLRETMVHKSDLEAIIQERTAELEQSKLELETNLHQLHLAKAEIEDQQKKLTDIFRSMRETLLVLSLDGTIIAANPAAHSLLGYQEPELVGQPSLLLLSTDTGMDDIWDIWARAAVSRVEEGKLHAKDGRIIPVRLSLSFLTNAAGAPQGVVCVGEDLTEYQTLETRIRQVEKLSAIGQLAAGIAHEINNPLGVIFGFAQGLERWIPGNEQLRLPVTVIVRESLRCKALVQELLTFSRTGKRTVEEIDLNALVRAAAVLVESRAKLQDTRIVYDLTIELPAIYANRTQIQQVIVNLSTNALDAIGSGGSLTFRTHGDCSDCTCLAVEDSGSGIPEEIRARIFEPFFTTKEVGKGTGLGLSLVHEIVQQHGGTIAIESEVGKGTAVTVRLPLGHNGGQQLAKLC